MLDFSKIVSVPAEELKPVDGHPLIFTYTKNFEHYVKCIVVINMLNRIAYVVYKNPECSILMGSMHIWYDSKPRKKKKSKGNPKEPQSLQSFLSRLSLGFTTININLEIASKLLCDLNYIDGDDIRCKSTVCSKGIDTLKKLSTDTEIVEVLDSIINE